MAKSTQKTETIPTNDEQLILETRKVKALEKIANSLDALTVWFEEIDKDEWSERVQYYLAEFHTKFVKENE
jgi:hypothetical protein